MQVAVSRTQPWEGFESEESGEAGSRWGRPVHEKAGERQRFRGWAGGRTEEKGKRNPPLQRLRPLPEEGRTRPAWLG